MKNKYTPALIVLTSLFFMWGLITSLNDILIPHLKALFDLSYVQAMLIQFCFFGAYFVMSFPSGYLVERVGYRKGIITGLLIAGLGCVGFYPAAAAHSYGFFLAALFVLASGHHAAASRCESLCRGSRRAAHCRQPPESHTGLQLARHYRRALGSGRY